MLRNLNISNSRPSRPDPPLAEEDRAARVELDRYRDQQQQRREQREAQQRCGDVEGSLEYPRRTTDPELSRAEQGEPVDVVELHRGAGHRAGSPEECSPRPALQPAPRTRCSSVSLSTLPGATTTRCTCCSARIWKRPCGTMSRAAVRDSVLRFGASAPIRPPWPPHCRQGPACDARVPSCRSHRSPGSARIARPFQRPFGPPTCRRSGARSAGATYRAPAGGRCHRRRSCRRPARAGRRSGLRPETAPGLRPGWWGEGDARRGRKGRLTSSPESSTPTAMIEKPVRLSSPKTTAPAIKVSAIENDVGRGKHAAKDLLSSPDRARRRSPQHGRDRGMPSVKCHSAWHGSAPRPRR